MKNHDGCLRRGMVRTGNIIVIALVWLFLYSCYSVCMAQGYHAFVREAREIEATDIGILYPYEISSYPTGKAFNIIQAGYSLQSKNLTTVSMDGGISSSVVISGTSLDPINMAYDSMFNRLLIIQSSGEGILMIPVDTANNLKQNLLSYYNLESWGLEQPLGVTVDPYSGQIFILDKLGPRLFRIVPGANGGFENAAVTEIDLDSLAVIDPKGLTFDPITGHLHLFGRADGLLYELDQTGQIVATRDLSPFGLVDPQAMMIAPSLDMTDDPQQMSLYIADSSRSNPRENSTSAVQDIKSSCGRLLELSFVEPVAPASSTCSAELIHTIQTSQFSPPCPDPSGVDVVAASDRLLICDSEVEEMTIWAGANWFETTLSGSLLRTGNLTAITKEPSGMAYNPANQHALISDDRSSTRKIFDIAPGSDGLIGTADDSVTSFSTVVFNSYDPEGVALDTGTGILYIADGTNEEVYCVDPGANGHFDGIDDQVTSFDTSVLGMLDPEGIGFNPITGHLYIVGNPRTIVAEVTTNGDLVQIIDISAANAITPSGVGFGPGSLNSLETMMYLSARGIDNDNDPTENDGKVYELSLPYTEPHNTAPTVDITSPADGASYTSGDSISFAGTAGDAEEGNLSGSIIWTSSRDGQIGSGSSFSSSSLTVGTHVITATVSDSQGLTGTDQVSITVSEPPNTAPTVDITSPADGASYTSGDSISFAGTAGDAEEGNLSGSIIWTSSRDGQIGSGSSFSSSSLTIGTHVITATVSDSQGLTGTDQVSITVSEPPNTAPTVDITSPVDGASYTSGTSISFAGTASDAEDGNLSGSIIWTSSRDGQIGSGSSFSSSSLSVGTHVITATVSDSQGLTGTDQVSITVSEPPNTAPTVDITSPVDGASYTSGTSISFAGTASDAEDGNLSGSIIWTSSRDGQIGSGSSFSSSSLSVGTHVITAAVSDSQGLTGTDQVSITVTEPPNTAPTVDITSPADGASYTSGDSISFAGTASDAEEGNLSGSIIWTSSRDGQIGSGSSFSSSSLSVGTHVITAAVSDSQGLTGTDQVSITVTEPPNTAPTVDITSPADGASYTSGDSISFAGTASDAEEGNLGGSIIWTSSRDGQIGSGSSFSSSSLTVGTHVITATVSDSQGLTGTDQVSITVSEPPNTAPTVDITSPADGASYTSGDSISFAGTAGDAEEGNLSGSIIWTSSRDGQIGSGSSFSSSSLTIGTHVITATVSDSQGLTGTDQVSITVTEPPNTAPTVDITSPADGASYTSGDSISFTGTASDVEEGNLSGSINWTSSRDGQIGSGSSFSSSSLTIGTHVITATVSDSQGLTGTDQVSITVTEPPNTAPTVDITSPADGASYTSGDSISFTGTAGDAEEGNLSGSIIWTSSRDGQIGSGSSFSSSSLTIGTHVITAAVSDSQGLTGTDQVSITVTEPPNTAPTVDITSPADGASYTSGDSISFTGTASDAEEGNLSGSIIWTSSRDGQIGSGSSFSSSSLTIGTHVITATVSDSQGLTGTDQVSITVSEPPNTAPTVDITSPADGASYTSGDSISFAGTASDAEDGNLSGSINWTSSRDGQIGSGSSFSSSSLSVGTHVIRAAVSDSKGLTGTDQVSITVTEPPNTIIKFKPSDDATVSSKYSKISYGSSTTLEMIKSTEIKRSYLKFNVTGLSGTIKSAKIRVYAARNSLDGGSVYSVSNYYRNGKKLWNENEITWVNAPALTGSPLDTITTVNGNTWVEYDVGAIVKANGVYSFALANTTASLTVFNSKEAVQYWPELVITTY